MTLLKKFECNQKKSLLTSTLIKKIFQWSQQTLSLSFEILFLTWRIVTLHEISYYRSETHSLLLRNKENPKTEII